MKTEETCFTATCEIAAEKKKVFIVDDDESVCRALGVLLVAHGFSVTTFASAEDFFSAVPNGVSGCLILDIHMPGLDGWEALKRMINSGSQRPVIIITADKNGEMGDQALQSGAAGFFQKPINSQELVDVIQQAY